MTETTSDVRGDMRCVHRGELPLPAPGRRAQGRRRLPDPGDRGLARLRRAGGGGPVALRRRGRRRRDHRGELRLDRCHSRLRRAQANRSMSVRPLGEDLRAAAVRDPDRVALVDAERALSYGELDRLVDGLAAGLRELGVGRGDRVAIVLPNGIEAAIAIYGVLRAGAAFSPLNPTIKREKLGHVLVRLGGCRGPLRRRPGRDGGCGRGLGGRDPGRHGRRGAGRRRRQGADAPGQRRSRRGDLHVGIDRRPEGGHADPRQHDLCRRFDHRVPGDAAVGRRALRAAVVIRLRPLPAPDVHADWGHAGPGAELRVPGPGRAAAREPRRSPGLPGVPTVFQVLLSLRGLADRELPSPALSDQHRRGAARAHRGGDPPHLPQRPPLLDVRADGVQARDLSAPGPARRPPDAPLASRSPARRPGSRTRRATWRSPARSAS